MTIEEESSGASVQEVIADIPLESTNDIQIPSFCELNPASSAGTTHFSISEFHSKDGKAVPNAVKGNIQSLMEQLEVIRAAFGGKPITINSGWRSHAHNKKIGGRPQSRHLCGQAADIVVKGVSPSIVHSKILQLIAQGKIIDGGVGRYNSFTHYDISNSRRW